MAAGGDGREYCSYSGVINDVILENVDDNFAACSKSVQKTFFVKVLITKIFPATHQFVVTKAKSTGVNCIMHAGRGLVG